MFTSLRHAGRLFLEGALQLVYPKLCWSCRDGLPPDGNDFCLKCQRILTAEPHATCPRCAGSVGPFVPLEGGCSRCRDTTFHFDGAFRLGPYTGALREAILYLKFGGNEALGEALGKLWARQQRERFEALAADVILPVPLHLFRYLARGFNQSEALAWGLSDSLRIPCRPRWLRRVRNTAQQTRQASPTARHDNVRGAFRARPGINLEGRTVLLVDDVMTTGSTASEAARALRVCRPARIVVAVLGHG